MVKNPKNTHKNLNLKPARTPVSAYRYTATTKNIILAIIIIATIMVCILIVASFFLKPEAQVKQKIESLANHYYEDIFYEKMLNSDQYSGNPADSLAAHADRGLAVMTLNQLLLADETYSASMADYLKSYCDESTTTIHFYPEAPYSRTSYRTEYHYACNF